ncbi:hypothetical protein [Paraglaciecola polaris]|uniref:Uncharacterized protein n=1 Tax=Paraglaciecola polaris LMG 21857 TaxID=1129793 RepID=K6YG59_9ALTE|nr:hypothetical protein [Paraglaciecola polaris]GAC31724.1 hypothetical protein GPLA_0808 [Paraglaciecola polaris LMG 21857]
MDTFINRIKVTSLSWLAATLLGSLLISFEANKNLTVVIAILGFAISYYYFVVRITTNKNLLVAKGKTETSDLSRIRDRAIQLYQFNSSWALKYSNERVESAYLQALLRTIDEDELFQEKRTSHFSELFTTYLTTFDTVYRKSYLSIDEVMIELQNKEKQTGLQSEFVSYLSSHIVKTLESKYIGDVQLIYKVEDEHLIVKKVFTNWFGIRIASFIRAIDSNKDQLGLSEIIGLELPPPNKSSQQDGN